MIIEYDTYIKKLCCNNEDLVQETYLVLLQSSNKELSNSKVSYAVKEARRRLMPVRRDTYKIIGKIETVEYKDQLFENEPNLCIKDEVIKILKEKLNELEFNIICDCYFNGLSFQEIGKKYILERNKIKTIVRRIKTKLSRNKQLFEYFKNID